jgi:hypothetical protein
LMVVFWWLSVFLACCMPGERGPIGDPGLPFV